MKSDTSAGISPLVTVTLLIVAFVVVIVASAYRGTDEIALLSPIAPTKAVPDRVTELSHELAVANARTALLGVGLELQRENYGLARERMDEALAATRAAGLGPDWAARLGAVAIVAGMEPQPTLDTIVALDAELAALER